MARTLALDGPERQDKLIRCPGRGDGAIVAIAGHVTEVSARLRAARERAGLTIGDVAGATKIRAAALEAIERGDFASLPGEFYARAFLRTYALELGLSPVAILDDYEAEHPHTEPAPAETGREPWRGAASQLMAAATSTGVVIALVVALLALAVANRPDGSPPNGEPGAVGTSGDGAAVPAPARATAAPATTAASAPRELTIEIQAAAPLWVTGAADGRRVLYRLLAPGERVSVTAADTLAFRVGDASAFTFSINGVKGKPIGGAGEVRDIEITRANYLTFTR